MVRNYMEQVVAEALPAIISKYENICKCEKCIDDIKALALNNLKPLYIATEKGAMYSKIKKLQLQFSVDVINEITRAIEIVSKNPVHNCG
ncbi:late competence development ComFB family protein [Clostridium sp. 19966]|uniref:late competence development ComFB family protein n=1 Tax=Clostridium sp. 19966 TaxID=2768166 RepID=UPI0028DD9942|nr:late competence development ComFB family protein [Clostridium sp. 19966]MDT8719467.1 late competence development ComFB family protein [Clostridium sp. 19966]